MVFQLSIGWNIIQGRESTSVSTRVSVLFENKGRCPCNPIQREFVEDLGNYTNWKEGHPGNNYFATIRQVKHQNVIKNFVINFYFRKTVSGHLVSEKLSSSLYASNLHLMRPFHSLELVLGQILLLVT